MRSSLLRLAMVLGVGIGLVGCQSSGSGGFSMWPWKKKEAETLVEDTTTPKLPSKLAQPQVLNQQGYGQYAAAGTQATTSPPTTSTGTQAQAPIYTASAPQYGQSASGPYAAAASTSPGATPVGYSPTPPPSNYTTTPNYASTGYPSMIQGGATSSGSTYTGQTGTGLGSTGPASTTLGYTATAGAAAYGASASPMTTPSTNLGLGSGISGTTAAFGNAQPGLNPGSQVAAGPGSNPMGQTGYQPGQTGYQPGQTGYNPPAAISPDSLPGMPSATAPAPGTQQNAAPARSNTPYRPGSTSDYIPGTLPGAASAPAATSAAPTSTPGTIPSGVPATPGYVPPASTALPGQSISGTSGTSVPSSAGDGHSGHHH